MFLTTFCASISTAAALLFATTAFAADPPQQKPRDWTVKDFRFHTGEVLPELKLHYVTIGEPTGEPVLVLHGSNASGETMLGPQFAGELFGWGQPLDAARFFLVLPDGIGHGKSSKPSDGLHARFPHYGFNDMVAAQYRLLTEGLYVNLIVPKTAQFQNCAQEIIRRRRKTFIVGRFSFGFGSNDSFGHSGANHRCCHEWSPLDTTWKDHHIIGVARTFADIQPVRHENQQRLFQHG